MFALCIYLQYCFFLDIFAVLCFSLQYYCEVSDKTVSHLRVDSLCNFIAIQNFNFVHFLNLDICFPFDSRSKNVFVFFSIFFSIVRIEEGLMFGSFRIDYGGFLMSWTNVLWFMTII